MSKIEELIKFKAKTKAVADDVNSNFEKLRVSNNEQEDFLNKLQTELTAHKSTPLCEIDCESDILILNTEVTDRRQQKNLLLLWISLRQR